MLSGISTVPPFLENIFHPPSLHAHLISSQLKVFIRLLKLHSTRIRPALFLAMAPPESEWMLWAYRVKTFMQAELDKVRQELPDRTASLLQDSDGLDSLKQQVHELAASSEHTHQTNQSLQHRIQKIESEATSQDQKLADQSGKLQATARDLERQIEHAVETFEQFKREARAAAEEREQEVADSKRQIEALALLKKTEKQGRSG